jgi:N4-(beta-N-acetylglucosaminyl)-L-asparaginase
MKKFFLRVSYRAQGLDLAMRDLQSGMHRHDVLEQAVRALELDPADDSVGYGGFPNIHGAMELDGAFMDGNNRMLGAVAAVRHFLPVRIARCLMERGQHVLLVGEGAELFARDCGLKPEPTLSEAQRERWERDIKPLLAGFGNRPLIEIVGELAEPRKNENRDTTVMIASDGTGISAAASTSGWPYKFPGRVGDTPVAGAGLYVDSRYGGGACTHTGEMSMRAGTARYIVARMEQGDSPRQAVHAAVGDLAMLAGGALRSLVVHAIGRDGGAHVVAVNAARPIKYQYWCEGMPEPECREAEPLEAQWSHAEPIKIHGG